MSKTCAKGHTFSGSDPCPECVPDYRTFSMRLPVWLYPGEAAWHFVTVPKKESALIRDRFSEFSRGFGSLPITVTVGNSRWNTSIFPQKKEGTYLLPVKASVRKAEVFSAGDTIRILMTVRV